MDGALILSAALMGLAGTPHCLAMCGPACAALGVTGSTGTAAHAWPFHVGRIASYAAAGAIAAGGVSLLGAMGSAMPMLKPLWSLVHVAALGLGLWLLITGRQPAWVERIGRAQRPGAATGLRSDGTAVVQWKPVASRFAAGSLWVAWPCGLLQSVIVVAALANGPAGGAAAMVAFAVTSGAGLAGGAALWVRTWRRGSATTAASAAWAVRAAGLMLVAASAWTLGHGMWVRVIDYCFS